MSTYQQKPNSGALFKNHRKEKDTHPDYRGTCNINGTELEISAWLKKSQKGEMFMSLAFQPPRVKPPQPAQPATKPGEMNPPGDNSDVPF